MLHPGRRARLTTRSGEVDRRVRACRCLTGASKQRSGGTRPTAVAVFQCRSARVLSGSTGHGRHLTYARPPSARRSPAVRLGWWCDVSCAPQSRRELIPDERRGRRRRATARHACAGRRQVDLGQRPMRAPPSRSPTFLPPALADPAAAAPAAGDRSLSAVARRRGCPPTSPSSTATSSSRTAKSWSGSRATRMSRGPSAPSPGSSAPAWTGTCCRTTPRRAKARSASS